MDEIEGYKPVSHPLYVAYTTIERLKFFFDEFINRSDLLDLGHVLPPRIVLNPRVNVTNAPIWSFSLSESQFSFLRTVRGMEKLLNQYDDQVLRFQELKSKVEASKVQRSTDMKKLRNFPRYIEVMEEVIGFFAVQCYFFYDFCSMSIFNGDEFGEINDFLFKAIGFVGTKLDRNKIIELERFAGIFYPRIARIYRKSFNSFLQQEPNIFEKFFLIE
ncbi:hypothetical protein PCE1_003161 [Barthelona sp. PCE]